MTVAHHRPALPVLAASPAWRAWRRAAQVFAANVAIWTILSGLGALTSLNDDLQHGVEGSLWLIFISSCRTSAVLAGFSFILYLVLTRWPAIVANAKTIVCGYALVLLLLLPLQLVLVAKTYLLGDAPGPLLAALAAGAEALAAVTPYIHWTFLTGVYFAVVALKIWQQSQARARAWAQAQADALALRLELEQERGMALQAQLGLERQRALALRAQLEPHFMFNALNAISAMVRTDRELALDGIHGLSELLRYALAAGEREWVKLGDELRFVDDYLTLQRLRYGARLHIAIEGASAAACDCDCPPLLLQPLIENALRHDLDCHESPSDILLTLERRDRQLFIRISNPVHREAAHNPGVGLGLRNIEARLELAYGPAATLRAGMAAGRFEVAITMPEYAPE